MGYCGPMGYGVHFPSHLVGGWPGLWVKRGYGLPEVWVKRGSTVTYIQHRLFWIIQFKHFFQLHQYILRKKVCLLLIVLSTLSDVIILTLFSCYFLSNIAKRVLTFKSKVAHLFHKKKDLDIYFAGTSTWFNVHSQQWFHTFLSIISLIFHLMLMLNENFLVWLVLQADDQIHVSILHFAIPYLCLQLSWSVIIGDSRKTYMFPKSPEYLNNGEYDLPNRRNPTP